MPFDRPTITEISARVEAGIESRLTNGVPILRRSVFKALSRVFAGIVHGNYGAINYNAKQLMPDTAEDEFLDRWANIWLEDPRDAATFAVGEYTFTGVDSTVIPAGTILQRSDEVQYVTEDEGTISGGTATVTIQSSTAGIDGNADAGTILSLVSGIIDIDNDGTIDSPGITSGAAQESDDSLLIRILERVQTPPQGGAEVDYVVWAKFIAGVTRVFVFSTEFGDGTVGVSFVEDDDPVSIIPDAAKVQEVQDYIGTQKPLTATVTVFAPTPLIIPIEVTLTPNTVSVQDAVTAELEEFFRQKGEPEATIFVSQINEAISRAEGEEDHVLTDPTTDTTATITEIPTLGPITFL